MYLTRKLKLGKTDQLDRLAERSGALWSAIVKWHWRFAGRQGHWPSKPAMQRWLCRGYEGLHSRSSQAVADSFYDALSAWREKRQSGDYEGLRPPYKQKKYFKTVWKSSAIRLQGDGVLRLSNGRGENPVLIDWPSAQEPKRVEIGWDGSQYELRAQYEAEPAEPKGDETAGVDLGEIHLAAFYTDSGSFLFNGRELRSLRRQQNRTKARFSRKIARKKRGSRRWKRLVRAKNRQLEKIRNQTRFASQTVYAAGKDPGGQTGRNGCSRRRDGNQGADRLRKQSKPEAPPVGILEVCSHAQVQGATLRNGRQERVGEAYTSQTCARCQERHKPSGRNYTCPDCGFEAHRDLLVAANIRTKYSGEIPIAGEMAPPTGVRYDPHMRCNPPSGGKTSGKLAPALKREKVA